MAPLSPYELAVRRAKNWKETVKSLWRTQLTMLILSIAGICLWLLALVIGVVTESMYIAIFIFFSGFVVFFVAYIFQWIFAVKVNNWASVAPKEDQRNISRVGTTLIIALVFAIVNSIASTISEYALEVGLIIQAIASIVMLVAFVVQVVAFARMSGSSTLPALAKKGAKSMVMYYIVSIASVIVGIVPIVYGIATVYSQTFYGDVVLFNDTMFLLGMFILVVGSLVSIFFYYRAWWLISKSELEVLPEESAETCNTIPQQGNW